MRAHIHAFVVDPLSLELGHPSAALLPLTWVEVGIEHSQERAVAVEDLVDFHVGVIYWYLMILFERNAIEAVGQAKDAFDDFGQLEVRAQHLGIDVVLLHLQLVGIESQVPRLHFEVVAFHTTGDGLDFSHLFDGCRFVCVDEVVEQSVHALGVAGHAVLQHVVGISLVT